MNIKKIAAAVSAVALTTAPVAAQAVDSVSKTAAKAERSVASANGSQLEGENGILIAILAAAAVIAGIIIIADDDDPDSP